MDRPMRAMLTTAWTALGGDAADVDTVDVRRTGALRSVFPVSDLAGATVAAAGLAAAEVVDGLGAGGLAAGGSGAGGSGAGGSGARESGAGGSGARGSDRDVPDRDVPDRAVPDRGGSITRGALITGGTMRRVVVDRDAASGWFGASLRPQGWEPPPAWDPVAGIYRCADGWIRLHTNVPAHRDAALSVLGTAAHRDAVAGAVGSWAGEELEDAVVGAGGCAGFVRSLAQWRDHPQGRAVAATPVVETEPGGDGRPPAGGAMPERPLAGVRVLDLTRVLAGPVATRALAGLGADVLRIDPPGWEEPGLVPEVTLGKRCARLDLRTADGHARLVELLRGADVVVHGLRPGALEGLGLGAGERAALRPGLVDVSLSAYGRTGPWAGRRGFDSVVQCSAGIADEGARSAGLDAPVPLPVQALDHGAGWLLAAGALRGIARARRGGGGLAVRLTLAGVALLLTTAHPPTAAPAADLDVATVPDASGTEHTAWGPATRMVAPLALAGTPWRWPRGAVALGGDAARWG